MAAMGSSRVVVAALLPLGILLGHSTGYALAGEHTHGYMTGGWLWAAPGLAAVAAVGVFAWAGLQGDPLRQCPRLSPVIAVQGVVFFGQESVEHLVQGHGLSHLLASPTLRWGLVAQVITATVLIVASCFALATGRRLRTLLGRLSTRARPRPWVPRPAMAAALSDAVTGSPASERGPPPFFVPA